MSRRTELEELVIREAAAEDGIVIEVRMGRDPGRERMKKLNSALEELDELLREEQTLDRRLAYSLYALSVYVDQTMNSWAEQGKAWPEEFVNHEVPTLVMYVAYCLEGDAFKVYVGDDEDEQGDETCLGGR